MQPSEKTPTFVGPLAEYCAGLYNEKRALGLRYRSRGQELQALDRFCLEQRAQPHRLSKELAQAWMMKRPHERPATQVYRVSIVRQLASYMRRQGVDAYLPPPMRNMPAVKHFTPYVFTAEEMRRLLAAADDLRAYTAWPQRSQVMPAIFRLLYGCGLRASEARGLRVRDVDLAEGLLTIRRAKFGKDRLVPLAPSLTTYLKEYAQHVLALAAPEACFFPAPDRGPLCHEALYSTFRTLLWACRISHGGVGRGPRLHDLRHTFAVHCLERWVREGKDLAVALPALSTYLGHVSLRGTQRYLRLTAALYPDITAAVEARLGAVIPERSTR